MLRRLHVQNFALVDDLEIEFSAGFNVLSGETGAGKSIIIGAISLILGERASTSHIREGAESALIEAIFEINNENLQETLARSLEESGITPPDADEPLIISRELFSSGKSSIGRINGRTVPVSMLRELGINLVDLHGQHQHQSLLNPDKHLELLDSFGGEKLFQLREELSSLVAEREEHRRQLAEIGYDERERERRLDLLNFQIAEIEDANLSSGEEEQLQEREAVLANAEKILDSVSRAYGQLSGEGGIQEMGSGASLRDQLSGILQEVKEASTYDPSLNSVVELLEGASANMEEASTELRNYWEGMDFSSAELEEVQDRLELIRNLKRKYGDTVEEVIDFGAHCREEYERLQKSEELAAHLEAKIEELNQQLEAKAAELSELRRETGKILEDYLQEVFPDLALEKAVLQIQMEPGRITSRGADRVEFMFSANPGESPRPLANIISGGEKSRVMLALKSVFAAQDRVPTLIFDEVDTGIGGEAVLAVAQKLAALSAYHQVMVVTHSPQVASMADNHYYLYKEVKDERTVTRAHKLDSQNRKEELARMLDGSADAVSLEHVEALLDRARKFKEKVFNGDKM